MPKKKLAIKFPKPEKDHPANAVKKLEIDDVDFEKSVTELEADLRRLPGAKPLSQVDRLSRNTVTSENDEEMVSEDEDDDEEEIIEEDELVEWIPPDCQARARIIVTDVTVDNFTVTLRESERPEGFFGQPLCK